MNASTPSLRGRLLTLRPLSLADVTPTYVGWLNDSEVVRHMETRHSPQTLETVAAYVSNRKADPLSYMWAMVDRENGCHVGNIKLGPVSFIHSRGEVSFFVGDRASWGRGLASEAVELVTVFGLADLSLHKITGGCYHVNRGSIRVFEKTGFSLEAVLKEQYLCEGQFVDRCCFARFAGTRNAI